MSNWIDIEILPPGEKIFYSYKTDDKFPIIAYKIRNSENSFYALGNYSIEQVYKYKRNESD